MIWLAGYVERVLNYLEGMERGPSRPPCGLVSGSRESLGCWGGCWMNAGENKESGMCDLNFLFVGNAGSTLLSR